jgi:hypothetical protein
MRGLAVLSRALRAPMTSARSTSPRALLVGRWQRSREAELGAVAEDSGPRVFRRMVVPPGRSYRARSRTSRGRLLGASFPGPSARLASLHRRCPRGLRAPAMALLRFSIPHACDPQRSCDACDARANRRPSPRPTRPTALPACRRVACPSDPRDEDPLSKHCRDRMGSGFPVPALL